MKKIICSIILATLSVLGYAAKHDSVWGYSQSDGPTQWVEHYPICGKGQSQSPIDIETARIKSRVKPSIITTSFKPMMLNIMNNGHTIEVKSTVKNAFTVGAQTYQVLQFHFHHHSENTLNGKSFPMEAHIVAKSKAGQMAVLALFIQLGKKNPFLQKIWSAMPDHKTPLSIDKPISINLKNFMPPSLKYYFYSGSLTTPPCTENVNWYVLATPVSASMEQVSEFSKLYPNNARPTQGLHHRVIKMS